MAHSCKWNIDFMIVETLIFLHDANWLCAHAWKLTRKQPLERCRFLVSATSRTRLSRSFSWVCLRLLERKSPRRWLDSLKCPWLIPWCRCVSASCTQSMISCFYAIQMAVHFLMDICSTTTPAWFQSSLWKRSWSLACRPTSHTNKRRW